MNFTFFQEEAFEQFADQGAIDRLAEAKNVEQIVRLWTGGSRSCIVCGGSLETTGDDSLCIILREGCNNIGYFEAPTAEVTAAHPEISPVSDSVLKLPDAEFERWLRTHIPGFSPVYHDVLGYELVNWEAAINAGLSFALSRSGEVHIHEDEDFIFEEIDEDDYDSLPERVFGVSLIFQFKGQAPGRPIEQVQFDLTVA